MDRYDLFLEDLRNSRVVLMPKNNIATFGTTTYHYYFLGKISNGQTHLCEGNINVNNPLFITPYTDERTVAGFPAQTKDHFKKFLEEIKVSNQIMVDYRFENISRDSWQEKIALSEALSEIKTSCVGDPYATILVGREKFWEPSLVKFCLKIFERSLPKNINEIREKGFHNQYGMPQEMIDRVEKLFDRAEGKLNRVNRLGNFLVEHDLFELYEERFFSLMRRAKSAK